MIDYEKHVLHDIVMIIKEYNTYLIHKSSTLYCKIRNVKLILTNHVLYLSKYEHPKIGIFGYCVYLSVLKT